MKSYRTDEDLVNQLLETKCNFFILSDTNFVDYHRKNLNNLLRKSVNVKTNMIRDFKFLGLNLK